ncbi:hypothetical protein [uncultured Alistipes sp.]|uniref:hypothetical protein n=1 Tax=uncultured Alistipes sp. TaxID=538949 RepID=UPI0026313D9E|nr:hypothetical protein [uncultured Alistipes sp.]
MRKKFTESQSLSSVRLTQEAKGKLITIAERKCTTLGIAASRIILHYATNNLDYEVSTGDAIKTILNNQASQHITLVKVAGATARTEDFIKTLLKREDYQVSPGKVDSDVVGIDDEIMEHADEERLSQAMLILEKFFSVATDAFDFNGKPVMQIRLSKDEYLRYKNRYEELCTSQTM